MPARATEAELVILDTGCTAWVLCLGRIKKQTNTTQPTEPSKQASKQASKQTDKQKLNNGENIHVKATTHAYTQCVYMHEKGSFLKCKCMDQ